MLPDIASSMSESVGCGLLASSADSGHDLARLAVAALNDLAVEPGLLDLGARRCPPIASIVVISEVPTLSKAVMQERTGGAVEMHGAGAAERDPAAELCAGHAEHVAQHPEEWRVAIDIDAVCVPVDFNGEGHGVSPVSNGYQRSDFRRRPADRICRSAGPLPISFRRRRRRLRQKLVALPAAGCARRRP